MAHKSLRTLATGKPTNSMNSTRSVMECTQRGFLAKQGVYSNQDEMEPETKPEAILFEQY